MVELKILDDVAVFVTPLRGLLAPGYLSKIMILLDQSNAAREHEGYTNIDNVGNDGGGRQTRLWMIHHLNAAKVSLALVKSASKRAATLPPTSIETADAKDDTTDVDQALQVEEFRVKFKAQRRPPSEPSLRTVSTSRVDEGVGIYGWDGCNSGYVIADHEMFVLLDVEHVSQKTGGGNDTNCNNTTPRNLGGVMRAIFSSLTGTIDQLSSHMKARSASVICNKEEGETDAVRHPVPVKARKGETSLFSNLLENEKYPLSICRLLSGILDPNEQGASISFDDIIEELDQMVNNPEMFLYDRGGNCPVKKLQFGGHYHGRVSELTSLLEASNDESRDVNAVFVSGAAGSGKSSFVRFAGKYLSNSGWMFFNLKFKRTSVHESREIVFSLFENMMMNIWKMGNGQNEADVAYRNQAIDAISNTMNRTSLSILAKFIPSLKKVIPGIKKHSTHLAEIEHDHWQLVFLISKLLSAIRSLGRHIALCFDDLQWCDSNMLALLSDVLTTTSQNHESRHSHLLIMGIYRDDEVGQSHPLFNQLTVLQNSSGINVTEIKLPALSENDICDMIMAETQLPRRLVRGLSNIVHRKTSGNAIFAVQFLNSLVQDSMVVYSPLNLRFDWDEDKISAIDTSDSVASLILSNLSRLNSTKLDILRVLSCLGMQSNLSLIRLYCEENMKLNTFTCSLESLAGKGIVIMSGETVAFSHDLIQQNIYDNIPLPQRQKTHLDLGLFFGSKTSLDTSNETLSISGAVDRLCVSDDTSQSDQSVSQSTLLSVATNQINAAGPQFIINTKEKIRFAGWNLHAGNAAAEYSNFEAAQFNYINGIAFLKDVPEQWGGEDSTLQMCRQLHEGAAATSFALGNTSAVEMYTQAIIDNVPLEDSLIAQAFRIKALKDAGRYKEAAAIGVNSLRLLKIDICSSPTPITVLQEIAKTDKIAARFTPNQIVRMKITSEIDERRRRLFGIVHAVMVVAYMEASPYLPLITCAMVNYSLGNGVVCESATAFVSYGYFRIFLEANFEEGRKWAEIARKVMDTNSSFASYVLYNYLLFWFLPHQELARKLVEIYEVEMTAGVVDNGMYAMNGILQAQLFGGSNLSLLSQSYVKAVAQMSKYEQECLRFTVMDLLLINKLAGTDVNPFPLDGGIIDEEGLLADAKHKNNNQGIFNKYGRKFVAAFWFSDYSEADKWFKLAYSTPSSEMPRIEMIHYTFYRGILTFQRHRNGEGDQWLDEGKKLMEKMELWNDKCNKAIFENKLTLLEAEHFAILGHTVASKESYELSAKIARDNGLVHEQGLAYEMYGKFLASICDDAKKWFLKAHECYIQWGAIAKANQLWDDHDLASALTDIHAESMLSPSAKHNRDECEGTSEYEGIDGEEGIL